MPITPTIYSNGGLKSLNTTWYYWAVQLRTITFKFILYQEEQTLYLESGH